MLYRICIYQTSFVPVLVSSNFEYILYIGGKERIIITSDIKLSVSGTLIGQREEVFEEPMPFTSQSASDTAAEAIERVKHSLEKMGFILGTQFNVQPTPSYRKLLENFDKITGVPIMKGVVS